MRIISLAIVGGFALMLSACGGGKTLSFKNSDEVITSYTTVTADMTEADRLKFRRNMFLVAWTSNKADTDISFRDVQTAWEYERNTVELTGPDATPLAKELALKGASKMDGKTVAQINEMGEAISAIAIDGKIQSLQEKIDTVDITIGQLNSDKDEWKERHKQAIATEASLVAQTSIYKPTITSAVIDKNWRGPTLTGKISLTNPHADNIYDFRNDFTIEHKGHVARYTGVNGQFTAYKKQSPFILELEPKSFLNNSGASLPADYVMPNQLAAYSYTFRPVWVRTSGKTDGWKEYNYKLDAVQSKAYYNLPGALKTCDQSIDVAQKLRASFEAQIELLEKRALDDLRGVSGRYAESCL